MKTATIKMGTRAEIVEYLKASGKMKDYNEETINEQMDWHIRQGHNLLRMDLTVLVDAPDLSFGCSAVNADESFILLDFNKEYERLWVEEMEDIERRRNQIDSWEMIVKMEHEAEQRDGEYVRAMLMFKDNLDKAKIKL